MRIRVPLGVPERRAVRERRVKAERQVMLHVRSAFSLIVIAPVVCGQKTIAMPL